MRGEEHGMRALCVCDVTCVWWERRRKGEEKGAGKICVKRNRKATARRKKQKADTTSRMRDETVLILDASCSLVYYDFVFAAFAFSIFLMRGCPSCHFYE